MRNFFDHQHIERYHGLIDDKEDGERHHIREKIGNNFPITKRVKEDGSSILDI